MTRKPNRDRRKQITACVVAIAKAITAVATLLILLLHGS